MDLLCSVKVLALRVRVAHVEHFASQGASVPQWLGLKNMIRDFWDVAADAAGQTVAKKRGNQYAVN
jgi:hypothetical protein